VRPALRAALVYNVFLERKLDMMRGKVSAGYKRGQSQASPQAADRLERWRENIRLDRPEASSSCPACVQVRSISREA